MNIATSTDELTQLVEAIGGKNNIVNVSHCLTRFRFVLNDPKLANIDIIKGISIVKGCFTQAGQFQVIIGTDVGDYYPRLLSLIGQDGASIQDVKSSAINNMAWWEKVLSMLSEIFVPLLPALISGGLLLGFRNIIGEMPINDGDRLTDIYPILIPIYNFLWLPCEAIFHFLPVAICWSTVKKMGGSPVLGIVLGVTLVSPQLLNAYAQGSQIPDVWDFSFIQIAKVGYQAQVIPSILAGLFLGWFEVRLKKIVPSYLYLVVVPFVSIVIAVVASHFIIGPIGRELGNGVSYIVRLLMTGDFAAIGSCIFGFFYSPLVITGIHHTTLAIDMQMTKDFGGTPIWPIIALSNIAQASAVVGMIIVGRKQERDITIPAAISAYLGVTEPAMYGVNLKYRYPMLCAMIGAALSGLVCGLFGVLSNGIGVGGLPGILSIQPQFWVIFVFAMLIAIVVPILLTSFIFKLKNNNKHYNG